MRHRNRCPYIRMGRVTRSRPVPNTTTIRGHIDLRWICGVHNDAMSPFEVESGNAGPVNSTIGGPEGSCVEPADVESLGIPRIDGQIIDMLRIGVECLPAFAAVL